MSDMQIPKEYEYSHDHVWIDLEEEPAVLGITEYAAQQLGELMFVDLPKVGTHVEAGDELVQLESSKSVEPMIAPVAGTVRYVNAEVERDAAVIADDPYGEGWIVKMDVDDDQPELLTAEAYEQIIKE